MKLNKLTTLLVVDRIEPCLATWETLGYTVVARVPEQGDAGFVMLQGKAGELMLQTHKSLADDLPNIAKHRPSYLLYADVASLTEAKKSLSSAKIIVAERKTFYGATEAWIELEGGVFMGLAEHSK
jgi:hypothetical protein